MIFCYLFEAKGIQGYLFRSGKLKDVIAASERLDRLIDSSEESVLYQVLNKAQLTSDLLKKDQELADTTPESIRFLRCKGGAFYSYCSSEQPLLALRSLWTLTIQQLFPSLEFTDALTSGENLTEAMDKAHAALAADRNGPMVKFPVASAVSARYQRSGLASVPASGLASRGSMKKEFEEDDFDIDTEHHRQAYQALKMRNAAALQDRFTPDEYQGKIHYPINLEEEFQTSAKELSAENQEATRDIALIHIDGNGLGILLRALKEALKEKSEQEYRQGFRQFSEALNSATVTAAKKATQWMIDNARYQIGGQDYVPMRPIVLGGDDLTLLCRADLAMQFSEIFCREFKSASEAALKAIPHVDGYLTASGGILYNKAGHPFTHSHHLVEELCAHAKKLTKSVTRTADEVGPAALAFYRISNSVSASFDKIFKQSQTFDIGEDISLTMGTSAYFVEDTQTNNLTTLLDLADKCRKKKLPVSMAKWRQMATQLAMGDIDEAEAIFNRARSLNNNSNTELSELIEKLKSPLVDKEASFTDWYWKDKEQQRNCLINDLLVVDHFRPVIAEEETK